MDHSQELLSIVEKHEARSQSADLVVDQEVQRGW